MECLSIMLIQEYFHDKVKNKGNPLETGSNINNDIEFSRKAELPLYKNHTTIRKKSKDKRQLFVLQNMYAVSY